MNKPNIFKSISLFFIYFLFTVICYPALASNTKGIKASVSVQMISQTISFGSSPLITVGGSGKISAKSSSGLGVILSSTTTNICSVNGITVTAIAAGTCTIAANQSGNTKYNPAPPTTLSFSLTKTNQTINFAKIPSIALGGSANISATASSGLPVSFASASPGTCTINGNVVTAISAGACTIEANQPGDTSHNAATTKQTFAIAKGQQNISFGTLPTIVDGQTSQLSATASSGLIITFNSLTPSVCSIYGNTVFGVSTGNCKIQAIQPGNANYTAAPAQTQSGQVFKPQSINFGTAPAVSPGSTATISASASSGLAITYSSLTPSVCSVNGNVVTGLTNGSCTIAANQSGNNTYIAAQQVTLSFAVGTGNASGGTNNSTAFPCESLGFSITATPAANQTALQNCISNHSNVSVTTPGSYQVAGTVILPSDISLQIGSGVNLYRAGVSGVSYKFFVNQNYSSTVYPVSGVSSASLGSSGLDFLYNVTIALPSTPAIAIGQYVLFKGDTTNIYNGIHKVTAVSTSANTVTFQMPYQTGGMPAPIPEPNPNAVTGIGMTLALADANITLDIQGGIWGQFSSGLAPVADSPDAHLLVFNKIQNLKILNFSGGDTAKYVINASNIYNSTLSNIDLWNRSDGIHFQTPLSNININGVSGDTGDSTIAFTPKDYVQYYNPDSQNGDMDGIHISNVNMTHCGNLVGIYPNGIYNISNVLIDNIAASSAVGAMVQVIGEADDTTHTSGTVVSGSNTITNLTSTLPWYAANLSGFYVTGKGIADGTYIVSHNPATNSAVMSQAAIGTYSSQAMSIISNGMQDDVAISNATPPKGSSVLSTVNVTLNTATLSGITAPDATTANDDVLRITSTNKGVTANARYWTSSSTANLYIGQPATGTNVPGGAYVTEVGSNYVDLSEAPAGSISQIRVKRTTGFNTPIVYAAQYSQIGTIKFQNSVVYIDNTKVSQLLFGNVGSNASIGELDITGSTINYIGNGGNSVIAQGLSKLNISDSQINGYGRILEETSSSTTSSPLVVNLNNVNVSRLYAGFGAVPNNTEINVSNLHIQPVDELGITYFPFFNFWNSGITVNLRLSNIIIEPLNQAMILNGNSYVINSVDNTNAMTAYGAATNTIGLGFTASAYGSAGVGTVLPSLFAYTSGNTLNLLGSDGSVNLDGTQFNYTRGDMFWNTNPAYSSGLGIYITGVSTAKLN